MKSQTLAPLVNRLITRAALTLMSAFVLFAGALGLPVAASAATSVGGTISADTTWTAANSPYVASSFTVAAGKTLTMQEGTIVKFQPGAVVYLYGTVRATGAATSKVIFTSLKDDDADGNDTNGDGTATQPGAGDWTYFRVYGGGLLDASNASFRYAGASDNWINPQAAIMQIGGTVSAADVTFLGEQRGVHQFVATSYSSFLRCTFSGGTDGVRSSDGTVVVDASTFQGQSGSGLVLDGGYASVTGSWFGSEGYSAVRVSSSAVFVHSGNAAAGGPAAGFAVGGTQAAASAVWNADLPYVTDGYVVPAGKGLTVGAGAVVKFRPGVSFTVVGSATVAGTADSSVCFTSLKDDTCGGDTNGDAGATAPAAADWMQITAAGTVSVSHASFSWGGALTGSVSSNATLGSCLRSIGHVTVSDSVFADCAVSNPGSGYAVTVAGGDFTAARTVFTRGFRGVWHIAGTATVRDSSFSAMSDYGVWSGPVGLNYVSYVPTLLTVTGSSFAVPASSQGAVSLNASVPFVHSGNSATGRNAGFTVGGTLAPGQLWNADLPYLVSYLEVPVGRTLAVGPGAAVKFLGFGTLSVGGTLDVAGTADAPVCFTSVKDDSCGGDTDGAAAQPAAGDWSQINAYGTVTASHASFSWGGALTGSVSSNATLGACLRSVGQVTVSDSTFADCAASNPGSGYAVTVADGNFTSDRIWFTRGLRGIWHIGGTATVRDSSFTAMSDYGITAGPVGLNYVSYVPSTLTVTGSSFTVPASSQGAVSLNASVPFVHSGNSATGRNAGFAVGGSLAPGQLWNADMPYIVSYVDVPAGRTLAVGPGAAVKFLGFGTLSVGGTLDVGGTSAAPVCFTSVKDDSCGGDTDGVAAQPAAVDWSQVSVWGTASISHASFSWGGALTGSVSSNAYLGACLRSAGHVTVSDSRFSNCIRTGSGNGNAVTVAGGDFTAERAEFADGTSGIWHYGGTATVRDSYFHGLADTGIVSSTARLDYITYNPASLAVSGSSFVGGVNGAYLGRGADTVSDSSFSGATGSAVVVAGSTVSVTGTSVHGNAKGLTLSSGTLSVHGSSIVDNATYAVSRAYAGAVVDATGNWWGSASGPSVELEGVPNSNPNRVSRWVNVSGPLAYDPVVPTPTASSLAQSLDGGAPIDPATGATDGREVVLSGTVTSPAGRLARLEVEVRPFGTPFSGAATLSESLGASGAVNSVHLGLLADGQYHWQARAVDQAGLASAWVEYARPGHEGEFDFSISSAPPLLSNTSQTKVGGAVIEEGYVTDGDTVIFTSVVTSLVGRTVKLQVQFAPSSTILTSSSGVSEVESTLAASNSTVLLPAHGLVDGSYHWRARAVDSSGAQSDWMEFGTVRTDDFNVAESVHVKTAVILYEPYQKAHLTAPVAPPCAQVAPTHQPYTGHDAGYFEDMKACLTDYFLQNSHGQLTFDIDTVQQWVTQTSQQKDTVSYSGFDIGLGKVTTAEKAADSLALTGDAAALAGVNLDDYDAVLVVHSGYSSQRSQVATDITTLVIPANRPTNIAHPVLASVIVSESDNIGIWAHELAHVAGRVLQFQDGIPDEYLYGGQNGGVDWDWSLMAKGAYNGGQYNADYFGDGSDPAPITTYDRILLGWLKPDIYCRGERGVFSTSILESSVLGDQALRYNLTDVAAGNACRNPSYGRYYLIEGRDNSVAGMRWGKSWPADFSGKDVVLYRVAEYARQNSAIVSKVTVKKALDADMQEEYLDGADMLRFTATRPESDGNGRAYVDIQPKEASAFSGHYRGAVVNPYLNLLAIADDATYDGAMIEFDNYSLEGDENGDLPVYSAKYSEMDRWYAKLDKSYLALAVASYACMLVWLLLAAQRKVRQSGAPGLGRYEVALLAAGAAISVAVIAWDLMFDTRVYAHSFVRNVSAHYGIPHLLTLVGTAALPIFLASVLPGPLLAAARRLMGRPYGLIAALAVFLASSVFVIAQTVDELARTVYGGFAYVHMFVAIPSLMAASAFVVASLVWIAVRMIPTGWMTSPSVERSARYSLYALRALALAAFAFTASCFWMVQRYETELGVNQRVQQVEIRSQPSNFGIQHVMGQAEGPAPLVHLQLSCPDGRFIGIDSATGLFVNQVAEAIVSGDGQGDPEWIYVPDAPENAGCEFSVSSAQIQQYLAAHPDVAAQLPSTTETYELYARTIDPAAGIFTSATVAGSIEPGEEVSYSIATAPDGTPTVVEAPSDALPPALSVASPLDGALTSASSVAITGTAPDADSGLASVTANGAPCALDGDAFSCAGVPLAEGPNEIVLVATDAAGNAASAVLHVSRDSVSPETSIDAALTGWTASTEAVIGFMADEPGSAFLCSLDGAAPASCLSPATLSGLADGAHTFAVHAVDPAGNVDLTPALAEWSVDAIAPLATIMTPASGLLTGTASVDVTVAASDAGSGLASVAVGETACTSSGQGLWLCAAVSLAEGENSLVVTVKDAVGNATDASVAVTSDTVAPSASGAAASLASGSVSATVSLSDASGVASAAATVRGPMPSTASAMSFSLALDTASGVWSDSAALPPQSEMPDGRYEVAIESADAAGNAASFAAGSFSLDRSSPESPDVSVAPSVARPGVTVAVSVSAADASSGVASVSVRDVVTDSVITLSLESGSAASGTWTGEIIAALPEGEHALTVTVTDAEGNATTSSAAFAVDAIAPSLALTSIPPALTNSAAASVAFSSDDATAAFACSVDGAEPVACASPFAVAALADGAHGVAVTATDPAGNVSVVASASWTVDTRAPETAIASGPAAASLTRSATFALTADEADSAFACSLDGAAPVPCASPYQLAALADGPHLLSVSATDPAGNADATPAEWRWSVAAPVCPVLAVIGDDSFTCAENPDGSTLVSIVGDKWRQAFAVLLPFGASPAAPRATVAATADDHNRNKPALSFLASLPAAAHAALTVPRGHASATYACVGAASLEIGPGCSGTRVTIPAPGQSATFAAGRTISTSADGTSVTVTGY